ncbi:MAG: DegT/DnrJ/EryC1/StrS family aminotransferase [Desulfovibrio sp.]|nr:DegT/DnrJ/EryC1/StrS family aminotransferase [Desulfovibrio sp.]
MDGNYFSATPVFADADPGTWNIAPKAAAAKVTPRTRAIMPVHIFGNPCAMPALRRLARAGSLRYRQNRRHVAATKSAKILDTTVAQLRLRLFGCVSGLGFSCG